MSGLISIGVSHNIAPLEIVGRLVVPEERRLAALRACVPDAAEVALLSTCNRCEIYAADERAPAAGALLDWLCADRGQRRADIEPFMRVRRDADAARHLIRVACGIESMIIGEPQILGQVKAAYREGLAAGRVGRVLSRLFDQAIAGAKKTRTETDIGRHPMSFEAAAVAAARRLFEKLPEKRLLLIGAGKMIEATARRFADAGIGGLAVAGRAPASVARLAGALGGAETLALDALAEALPRFDIVVSCTAASAPVLHAADADAATRKRRRKPICVIDMAVPADVEPAAGELPDIYLFTLADLAKIVDDGRGARGGAVAAAERIVDDSLAAYREWLDARGAAELITRLRADADDARAQALDKARGMLRGGATPEDALAQLASALTGKLTHPTTRALRAAAAAGRADWLATARELFAEPARPTAASDDADDNTGDASPTAADSPATDAPRPTPDKT